MFQMIMPESASPAIEIILAATFDEYADLVDFDENEDSIDIGMCMCGRYGRHEQSCIRRIDGRMEECGQFV